MKIDSGCIFFIVTTASNFYSFNYNTQKITINIKLMIIFVVHNYSFIIRWLENLEI